MNKKFAKVISAFLCLSFLLAQGGYRAGASATPAGLWTWIDGPADADQIGVYGTLGVPNAANVPGARHHAAQWIDASGNLWLFGGEGIDSAGNTGYLNDLWKFDRAAGQWTWMGGSNVRNQNGVYGTEDLPGTSNIPGSRYEMVSWTDAGGNFWLFGGFGYASAFTGYMNDLWKYNPATGEWTWVDGTNSYGQSGVYGTEDVPSASNVPGGRWEAVSWVGTDGSLWLFGGQGLDKNGTFSYLNDLWKFNPATGEWTWVDGADVVNQSGVYGTEDSAAASNVPGARKYAMSWSDFNGSLWLFGGFGYDSAGAVNYINDLWKFNPANGQWTWVDGSNTVLQGGTYGTEDTASAANVPGARMAGATWLDTSGALWLFGGLSKDSGGLVNDINDLWKFTPSTGQWTWIDGSNQVLQAGSYGTEDTPDALNVPGARYGSAYWMDSEENLWVFGGAGVDGSSNNGYLSDLWRFATLASTYASAAVSDGHILESSEFSNTGGTKNNKASYMSVGDSANNSQYRSLLSFNTSSLPDTGITIVKITLKVKQAGSFVGGKNPVALFGGFKVDVKKGNFGKGALESADFQAKASKTVGSFKSAPINGWYILNLTPVKSVISRTGNTQIRLRFAKDDNNNFVANYLKLYSGSASLENRPQLIIEYSAP